MSDRRILLGSALALGVAFVAAWGMVKGSSPAHAAEDGPGPNLVIEVAGATTGTIVIDLLPEVAPRHVEQLVALAKEGAYDGVVFHRVIDGFMAQTGDVSMGKRGADLSMAGTGGSSRPDLPAEFSSIPFDRGTVGMARAQDPNSANSQFFMMFAPSPNLDGQYTVVGQVVQGLDVLDAIKKGDSAANGAVRDPDYMAKVTVQE
jgi:peptidylprolyl isomerase